MTDHFIISKIKTLFGILTKKDKDCKIMTGHYEEEITPKFFTCQWSVNKVKENLVYCIDKNKQVHVLLKVKASKAPDYFTLKG